MDQLDQIKKDWDDMAEIDATWFNVPGEHIGDHKWEMDNFFHSGKSHIKKELELIAGLGIVMTKGVALDFGCGIGRITQALAEEFETCYGVDISEKMIQIAMHHNRFGEQCKYIANQKTDLGIFNHGFFDFIFSTNALQHNPPDVIKSYIGEFVRILKPDGVLLFQLPVEYVTGDTKTSYLRSLPRYHPKRIWNKLRGILIGHDTATRYNRLRRLGFSKKWLHQRLNLHPNINMYSLEETEILQLLESRGCSVKHIEKYDYKDMLHANFIAVKLS